MYLGPCCPPASSPYSCCCLRPRVRPGPSAGAGQPRADSAVGPLGRGASAPIAPDELADSVLVDVRSGDSTIQVDARYATPNNFTGAPLPGYDAPRALLRREAAAALARVQRRLRTGELGLRVFDGYRPVRATLAMVAWTERTGRRALVDSGYIARRSRHNMGVAVDLTLVDLVTGTEVPMGTPFDAFTEAAHTANARAGSRATARSWSGPWRRRASPTTTRSGGTSAIRWRAPCRSTGPRSARTRKKFLDLRRRNP